jgi:hypothetical protein
VNALKYRVAHSRVFRSTSRPFRINVVITLQFVNAQTQLHLPIARLLMPPQAQAKKPGRSAIAPLRYRRPPRWRQPASNAASADRSARSGFDGKERDALHTELLARPLRVVGDELILRIFFDLLHQDPASSIFRR